MKLNIYKDELFREVREVREVPRMKVPYRTAETLTALLSDIDLAKITDAMALRLVLNNTNLVTQVVQATFGLADEDLPFVDLMEMVDLAKDIIDFVLGKMAELNLDDEGADPNAQTPVTMA